MEYGTADASSNKKKGRGGKRVLEYLVTWQHEDEGSKVSGNVMKVALMDFLSLVKLRV